MPLTGFVRRRITIRQFGYALDHLDCPQVGQHILVTGDGDRVVFKGGL